MAFGTVYVFNIYSAKIVSLSVNDQSFTTPIEPPIRSNTADSPYTPFSVPVPRTNLTAGQLNGPKFVNGVNNITIHYEGDNGKLQIKIPAPPELPLESDLWLYLSYKHASLYETTGTPLPNPQAARLGAAASGLESAHFAIERKTWEH